MALPWTEDAGMASGAFDEALGDSFAAVGKRGVCSFGGTASVSPRSKSTTGGVLISTQKLPIAKGDTWFVRKVGLRTNPVL
jgi:hypothetical protein